MSERLASEQSFKDLQFGPTQRHVKELMLSVCKETIEINICWVIILLMLVSFSFHDITVLKLIHWSHSLISACVVFQPLVFHS